MSDNPSQPTLRDFSTCEISDALVKLGAAHGGLLPDIHPLAVKSGARICGPAYTVQMVAGSDTTSPRLTSHFVDTAPAHSVIVIDAPQHLKNAVWGGLMSAQAKVTAAAGVVISGRCRDLGEHRVLEFPVFARSHSTLGQSPFVRPSQINVSLTIHPEDGLNGGLANAFPAVTISPGDWIIADEDGVVCVPKESETKVVELARIGREVDARCMEDIQAGKGIQATFRKHRGK